MFALAISFLVLINPFALFIYLQPVMRDLGRDKFLSVLLRAELISLVIYLLFALTGEWVFQELFQIDFESFRIFGGIVIALLALLFIVGGKSTLIAVKEDLDDLASEIALPFLVGAATIAQSILLGQVATPVQIVLVLGAVLAINHFLITAMMLSRERLSKKLRTAFDKNMSIFLRVNSFFVGAIGLNMVITGINNLYF